MSFKTKSSMWWGTVKYNTENFFGKDQKRIVAHEFYDNPNAPSQRPKSTHTIRSQSKRSIQGDEGRKSSRRSSPVGKQDMAAYQGDSQQQVQQRGYSEEYPQANVMQEDPTMPFNHQQQQQWGNNGYDNSIQDPNMMMMMYQQQQQQDMMYPQDPNIMAYQQDPNMLAFQQDPNMVMYQQQQGMFPQQPYPQEDQNGYPQQYA